MAVRAFFEEGHYLFFSPCLIPLAWEGGCVEEAGPDDLLSGAVMEEHEGEGNRDRNMVFKGHRIMYE